MLKSITISPYKENSSFGEKARWIARSLDQHDGLDNTNACVYQEDTDHNSFKSSSIEDPDFCIQYVRSLDFVRTPYKNIGIFEPKLKGRPYEENVMGLLDNIIVHSNNQKNALPERVRHKCIVARPIVPPFNNQNKMKRISLKFNFYTSAIEEDANIDMIIIAYLTSFTSNDNVTLNILCNNLQETLDYVNKLKENLGLYKKVPLYPDIFLQTETSIHATCHCFIDASMGYDIPIHTMLAVASSNPIITSGADGLLEWVDEGACYKFRSYDGCRDSYLLGNIPEFSSLKENLLEAFKNRKLFSEKQDKMISVCCNSFDDKKEDNIGDILCSLL
tara:strand:+ start:4426 stop:5424 length:999 start_codon:yes stop_codon:yes gene_type:complete